MKNKILMIDNYDSFTYNLVHYIEKLNYKIDIIKNDDISLTKKCNYDKIIISPGPGLPKDAGFLQEFLSKNIYKKNILGICLGHQAIIECIGGKLKNLQTVYHGVASDITIKSLSNKLFKNIPQIIKVGRYHSWIGVPNENADVLAVDNEGNTMSVQLKKYPVWGVQFHPESILTNNGLQIIHNWLKTV